MVTESQYDHLATKADLERLGKELKQGDGREDQSADALVCGDVDDQCWGSGRADFESSCLTNKALALQLGHLDI